MKPHLIAKELRTIAEDIKFMCTNGSGWNDTGAERAFAAIVILAAHIEADEEDEAASMGRSLEVPRADLSPIKVKI